MERCEWARSDLAIRYHDDEWGVATHDDRTLFEYLTLEGAQAGLSWETILKKRDRYREVFDRFDPEKVARYGARKTTALLKDPGIVRNRLKVASAVWLRIGAINFSSQSSDWGMASALSNTRAG